MADTYQLARETRKSLVLSSLGFSEPLTAAQRVEFFRASAAYTLAHPTLFTELDLQIARQHAAADFSLDPDTYSLSDAAGDFADEMANQAEEINPLSERNRGSLSWYLMLLGFVAVALYFAGRSGLAKQVMEARK